MYVYNAYNKECVEIKMYSNFIFNYIQREREMGAA
jgi:hypothetical protein